MQTQLTREVLEHAFDEMGRLAGDRGLIIEIAVYGGAALMKVTKLTTEQQLVALLKECNHPPDGQSADQGEDRYAA